MHSIAVTAVALLLPSYGALTSMRRTTLHAEDPEFLPGKAQRLAREVGNTTTATKGSLDRLPKVSSSRRLDEDLKLCDGLVDFTTHIITVSGWGAQSVAAADLDGDGDVDILAATYDDTIAWYENLDGAGNFSGPEHIITDYSTFYSIAAADLDGDGAFDLLFPTDSGNIVWYKNLDGAGTFSRRKYVIATLDGEGAYSVAAADLDGDGYLDVLSNQKHEMIVWYKNLDGAGEFSGPQHITTLGDGDVEIEAVAADLDGDGDLDVLVAYLSNSTILWFENLDGAGDFSGPQRVISTEAFGAMLVVAADLDGDADLDVLWASCCFENIGWYENLGSGGNFSGRDRVMRDQVSGSYALSLAAADLDGDGDLDVLFTTSSGKVAWYENLDGAGDFSGPQRVITSQAHNPNSVAVADLDGDANLDILPAAESYSMMVWFEQTCGPMTPQPTLLPTPQPTPEPTPEPTPGPTYWGPQVFGKKLQTVGFRRLCVTWCIIFGVISVAVLRNVVYASQDMDKKLARNILTIVLSQYEYGSDTLFIGFQNFVTPALLVASVVAYFLPLAVFIVVYRRVVGMHLARIYEWTTRTFLRHKSWDNFPKALIGIATFVLFPFALFVSIFVYVILLFVFISCKLTSISFFAAQFLQTGGFDCTQEAFEVMFKRNIFFELVFESSGELMIVLVDYFLRARQEFRLNTGLSSWALLSIVGSSLMLAIEAWPYLYNVVLKGLGLNAGIAAVKSNLEFTPDKVPATCFIEVPIRFARLDASDEQTIIDTNPLTSESGEIDCGAGHRVN